MGFRDGRKVKVFNHNKIGYLKEYSFYDDSYSDKPFIFRYKEHDGIDITVEEIWGDLYATNSSGISIEVYSNYEFKPKDIFIDIFGNEYR